VGHDARGGGLQHVAGGNLFPTSLKRRPMPTQDVIDRVIASARSPAERGDQLLHVQLEITALAEGESSWGASSAGMNTDSTIGQFISYVEKLGWMLQHVGYTFVETGSSTSARMFSTGEGRVNQGVVLGFFTYRRVEQPAV
jgi:hypothetical protein